MPDERRYRQISWMKLEMRTENKDLGVDITAENSQLKKIEGS